MTGVARHCNILTYELDCLPVYSSWRSRAGGTIVCAVQAVQGLLRLGDLLCCTDFFHEGSRPQTEEGGFCVDRWWPSWGQAEQESPRCYTH